MLQNRKLNLDLIVSELLKAVRGKRSQQALSKRLGYSFNQVGKWEAGYTKIRWDEFVRLCNYCKAPLAHSLLIHYKFRGSSEDSAVIIEKMIQPHKTSVIAKKLGISRHSLTAWLKSQAYPSLQEMFVILLLYRGGDAHLISFIGSLIKDIENLPSIKEEYLRRQQQIAFAYQYPWLGSVTDCLSLESYNQLARHQAGFIAKHLRITLAEEKMALEFLSRMSVLTVDNDKYVPTGKKLALQENILENPTDIEGNFKIREYWWAQALQHLNERPPWASLTYAFQTLAMSDAAFRKVRASTVQYFTEVSKIIEEDTEEKTIFKVMNLCFFDPSAK